MEKSRFGIISDLFRLSHIISDGLVLAESFVEKTDKGNEAYDKDTCNKIKYGLKNIPFLLDSIREYIAEHDDKELARKFVSLHDDTKRLYDLCSKVNPDLDKVVFHIGMAYLSMEAIEEYFFPKSDVSEMTATVQKPITRTEITDCIDSIRLAIGKGSLVSDPNKGKEMYAILSKIDKNKIQAIKEYIVDTNDKDLAQLFTEYFTKAVHLSMLSPNADIQGQSAAIKMFHIALTMGYIKRNILCDGISRGGIATSQSQNATPFIGTNTSHDGKFSTTVQIPALRLYRFLTCYMVGSGADKGKALLDGNAVSENDFVHALLYADYSKVCGNCVKGKLRCTIILLSKAYFKDWKEYRKSAANSMGLTTESLAKYNVERTFITKLKELLPMIK